MNPINMIMNYLIAESRSKHYNVTDKQKIQTTALLMGGFSQNPIVDYLVIDNQAKNLQSSTVEATNAAASNSNSSSVTGTNTANTIDTDIKALAKKIEEIISQNAETQKQIGKIQTNDKNLSDNIFELKKITKKNSDEIIEIWKIIKKYDAIITSKPATSTESTFASEKKTNPKTK